MFYIVFYYLWTSEGLLTDSANHPKVGNVLPWGFFNKYIDMKVQVKEKEPNKEIKYPCLMKAESTKMIVLFLDEKKGTVVSRGGGLYELGDYLTNWEMEAFTPFNGTITLQND